MQPKTTSIALGEHFTTFVTQQVETGRFGSASEVIRAALRLFEEREAKLRVLRAALNEGRNSPMAEDYSLDGVLESISRAPKQ